jgi:short subunit dehydrogenase-like uncharacterized protein
MICGATGYTAGLIERELARHGTAVVIAGRDEAALRWRASALPGTIRSFGLADPAAL